MVEGILSCEEIAKRCLELFTPVYETWHTLPSPDPSLVNDVSGKSAARILENDMRELGMHLINSDLRSTRIELGVLVDCIAVLRSRGADEFVATNAQLLESEFGMAQQKNASSSFTAPPLSINMPLSLRVARDVQHSGKTGNTLAIKEMLLEFLHRIVLQDGKLTTQELLAVKEIEEFLDSLIDNAV